ncbi:ATP-dependent DNA helicase [Candidatus Woesearchaeota archaeon]|nr:ATP-dependent DNA helicase [Candidatus Woesearchaeota archaeon]
MGEARPSSMPDDGEEDIAAQHLFPYSSMRNIQHALVQEVARAVAERKDMIVHAPTGLGKTAATLAPAVKYALENEKKVFFLTSRHTQHLIAIETLREIKEKYNIDLFAVDMIGKKWMCSVPGVDAMNSNEFYEYCKKQREDELCDYYNNTKSGTRLTPHAQKALDEIKKSSPCHMERFRELCGQDALCAYEMAALAAKEATVIVADYYYIYNPHIRDPFLKKAGIKMEDCIVIVDEGHNLPDRIRNLMTEQTSNFMLKKAINEAKKIEREEMVSQLSRIQDIINELSQGMNDGDEKLVTKDEFVDKINKIGEYADLVADFELAAQFVREKERQSSIGGVAQFLDAWLGEDKGHARIITQKKTKRGESIIMLSYRCLDPSIVSAQTIDACHSTIIMSGTLTPTEMYKDILGFPDDTVVRRYKSPFPESNRLSLIVPETTTKFSQRNPEQFRRIAEICAEITNLVPGNSAIFFPSYWIRDQVYAFFSDLSKKTAFLEDSEMGKEERTEFLDRFKSYKDSGAVLIGVMTGSFGEGVDLPGDLLKCVVVVGLPLQQPTLETKKLIEYYDDRFSKGWDYGYVGPAFTKCLQSAGRCIRSETDRGVIVFLEERYVWQNYFKHFPRDMEIEVSKEYREKIKEFFK